MPIGGAVTNAVDQNRIIDWVRFAVGGFHVDGCFRRRWIDRGDSGCEGVRFVEVGRPAHALNAPKPGAVQKHLLLFAACKEREANWRAGSAKSVQASAVHTV